MSDLENYIVDEKINEEKHFLPINDFECQENESLELFLKCFAIQYEQESQGSTYIVRDINEILAFYTLKCNAVQMKEYDETVSVPAIELARLAVKSNLQNKGWGTAIFVNYILPKIIKVKKIIAVKFIMVFVEGNDNIAINFYKKFGFELASEEIQNYIKESYSDGCKIMLVSLDTAKEVFNELNS